MSYAGVNAMSLRELFNAISGFREMQEDDKKAMRTIIYGAMRYSASSIAGVWSNKHARSIQRQYFDWERPQESLTPEESKKRVDAWLSAR